MVPLFSCHKLLILSFASYIGNFLCVTDRLLKWESETIVSFVKENCSKFVSLMRRNDHIATDWCRFLEFFWGGIVFSRTLAGFSNSAEAWWFGDDSSKLFAKWFFFFLQKITKVASGLQRLTSRKALSLSSSTSMCASVWRPPNITTEVCIVNRFSAEIFIATHPVIGVYGVISS